MKEFTSTSLNKDSIIKYNFIQLNQNVASENIDQKVSQLKRKIF